MALRTETGFGARLQNAQTLSTYLQAFANYNPPREEEKATVFAEFVEKCASINTQIASNLQDYTLAVKNRTDAFTGQETNSFKMLLSPILKSVHAQYGRDSREYSSVSAIIGKLRSAKLVKVSNDNEEAEKISISQSELSYGSQLQNFRDLVTSLGQCQRFAPSNPLITLDSLKSIAEKASSANQDVASKYYPLKQAREQRSVLFEELKNRAQRIKSYISAMYGNKSSEYKSVSSLKI